MNENTCSFIDISLANAASVVFPPRRLGRCDSVNYSGTLGIYHVDSARWVKPDGGCLGVGAHT